VPDRIRAKKVHPALKHGGYSATAILPGEDRAEFEELYQGLIAELRPDGPLEDDVVAQLACLVWRKQNLSTYRKAEIARQRYDVKVSVRVHGSYYASVPKEEEIVAAECAAEAQAREQRTRKELGDAYELVAAGEIATRSCLEKELKLEAELDAHIDRCLKRLLHVRGIKSLSTVPAPAPLRQLSGGVKAA
jgi:hypothetical protein